MGWAMMIVGLLFGLAASALLLMGAIESGLAVAIGMLGIGLIAASGRWMRTKPGEKPRAEHIERTIYSPDRQLRALVRQRADGVIGSRSRSSSMIIRRMLARKTAGSANRTPRSLTRWPVRSKSRPAASVRERMTFLASISNSARR